MYITTYVETVQMLEYQLKGSADNKDDSSLPSK